MFAGAIADTALSSLTDAVWQILTPVITVFAALLAHKLVSVFEKKTKIDIPDAIEQKIDAWIEQGIALATEKAHQKVKTQTEKLKGPEKLEEAASFVFDLAESRGWVNWSKDRIKAKIEARLGKTR